jgi:aconitate hydratase
VHRIDKVGGSAHLPLSLKILLENLLRSEDGVDITAEQISSVANWDATATQAAEILFTPARVLLQDFAGVPCIVDLAAMRDATAALGGNPQFVNPLSPVELVIDHSVIADYSGTHEALSLNVDMEYSRNAERYELLKWGQSALQNLKVVPPGAGIVHQVNLEHLARVVMTTEKDGFLEAYPDTCVGTDSHTTMVNGLGVLAWGVGGIEADAAMLGQPLSMLIPRVVGVKVSGKLGPGVSSTDLVLTLTQLLRKQGVVGKFVEFYGHGISELSLPDRATIANMSPEFGCTSCLFPIDSVTLEYLRLTGREESRIELVEAYAKLQSLWLDPEFEAIYSEYLTFDLGSVVPSVAGPRRPQDRISLSDVKAQFAEDFPVDPRRDVTAAITANSLTDGSIVIAAITSCTNTSNPSVMITAGLLARNARRRGLTSKPWVKTTLAPGSKVVADYYDEAGLTPFLEELGFFIVGYGCTTCVGNSGPLETHISSEIADRELSVAAVLSGNRNFEGRVHSDVKLNYLASPPLVVAYALAGTVNFDFEVDPLGIDDRGDLVYLRDIWPSDQETRETIKIAIKPAMFRTQYNGVYDGDLRWAQLATPTGTTYGWDDDSTYIRRPPFLEGVSLEPNPIDPIAGARVLAMLGDSITTDHISPVGTIKQQSPAGLYLTGHGVPRSEFNTYGSRRGNHEVMLRGAFSNPRLKNLLLSGIEGGFTRDFTMPSAEIDGSTKTIFEVAENYRQHEVPLVLVAGKEYGTGSSRDWAAKATTLLGVRAIIAESYERIHRSNLVGMGVLPLEFLPGQSASSLGLNGTEEFNIEGVEDLGSGTVPRILSVQAFPTAHSPVGSTSVRFEVKVRVDTQVEADYYRNGGILPFMLRKMVGLQTAV